MKVGLLGKFVNGRKNTLPENIIVCLAAALAGTFYNYEYYYGETVHTAACLLIPVLIGAIWLVCGAVSGRDGRLGFIIFAFLYWSVPYAYTVWYSSRDNLRDYNKWLAMCNKVAKALLNDPFEKAAEKLGTAPVVLAAVLAAAVTAAYVAGYIAKRAYKAEGPEQSEDAPEEQ